MSMNTTEYEPDFIYQAADPATAPKRQPPRSPGRPSLNPHKKTVQANALTERALSFRLADPCAGLDADDEAPERRKLIDKHTRYLRSAAHEVDRGVKVWSTVNDDDTVTITFQDTVYTRRPRNAEPEETQAEGNDE